MPCRVSSVVMIILFLSGCACFKDAEPDFDKPLITIPKEKLTIPDNQETKPSEKHIWVEAKTSRIWVSPHVDKNGDYIDGYYKYIVLVPGHWSLNGRQAKSQ